MLKLPRDDHQFCYGPSYGGLPVWLHHKLLEKKIIDNIQWSLKGPVKEIDCFWFVGHDDYTRWWHLNSLAFYALRMQKQLMLHVQLAVNIDWGPNRGCGWRWFKSGSLHEIGVVFVLTWHNILIYLSSMHACMLELQNQEEQVTFDTIPNVKKQHEVHVGEYLCP